MKKSKTDNAESETSPATSNGKAPKSRRLACVIPEGKTEDQVMADFASEGVVANAGLMTRFAESELGELSLTDMVGSLRASSQAVQGNDMRGVEQMLVAQAASLNAIFCELARRSALNMGTYMEPTERYMRLALKAQGQCRATLETLAAIKNPPVVFARQANIANGPQQVNNGTQTNSATSTRAPAQAYGETVNPSNELLEQQNGTWLDAGTQSQAGPANPWLAAVGAVNRTEVAGREGEGGKKQPEARRTVC